MSAYESFIKIPGAAEYGRLAEHCITCPTCSAVDANGANLERPCAEDGRLREAYWQACRSSAPRYRQARRST